MLKHPSLSLPCVVNTPTLFEDYTPFARFSKREIHSSASKLSRRSDWHDRLHTSHRFGASSHTLYPYQLIFVDSAFGAVSAPKSKKKTWKDLDPKETNWKEEGSSEVATEENACLHFSYHKRPTVENLSNCSKYSLFEGFPKTRELEFLWCPSIGGKCHYNMFGKDPES